MTPDTPVLEAWEGEMLVHFANALWEFSEACPEPGSDWSRLDEWHTLMPSMVMDAERLCAFYLWQEGVEFARAIAAHLATVDEAADDDEALLVAWWRELTKRCGRLSRATRERWPKDEDDEGDE